MSKIKIFKLQKYLPSDKILAKCFTVQRCQQCLEALAAEWYLTSKYKHKHTQQYFDDELFDHVSIKTLQLGLHHPVVKSGIH